MWLIATNFTCANYNHENVKNYFYTEENALGNHHYRSVPRYRHVVIHIEDAAAPQKHGGT